MFLYIYIMNKVLTACEMARSQVRVNMLGCISFSDFPLGFSPIILVAAQIIFYIKRIIFPQCQNEFAGVGALLKQDIL